jgi:hypothetical protein
VEIVIITLTPGANNLLTPAMVDKADSVFSEAGLVVVGLEVDHAAIVR